MAERQIVGDGGGRFMLVAASPAHDVPLLRNDVITGSSEAFRALEAAGTARVLVLVPLFEGEGKNAYNMLIAIVSDFAQHHGFASGVMGTEGGGGAARRFQ